MRSFLVIGMGRFGRAVSEELIELGHDVVAIESDETIGQNLADQVAHVVIADAKEEGVLRSVGVGNFDCVIVAMTSIEDSIMVTLMVKELGAQYVVAKAKSKQHMTVLKRVGADRVVFPERDMGQRVAQSLAVEHMIDCIELSPEDTIVEIPAPQSWVGKDMIELDIRKKYQVNILAVRASGVENSLIVELNPHRKFCEGDVVFIIGKRWKTQKLGKLK
ncbi:MAG: TrkA family potassium uptake protein [Eubacteriales bacterium]|nr:TrkA family potassium uptake protein [Eubacteriales bacterium]